MCTDLANFQMVEVIFSRALRNSCAKQIFSAKEWNQNIYDQLYSHAFNSIRIHLEDQWIEINLMFIFGLQWPIRHAIVEDWDLMVCNYCISGL